MWVEHRIVQTESGKHRPLGQKWNQEVMFLGKMFGLPLSFRNNTQIFIFLVFLLYTIFLLMGQLLLQFFLFKEPDATSIKVGFFYLGLSRDVPCNLKTLIYSFTQKKHANSYTQNSFLSQPDIGFGEKLDFEIKDKQEQPY